MSKIIQHSLGHHHGVVNTHMVGWLVGWLFFFYITKQTGNSAQYYDGDGIKEGIVAAA